ncbi:hypothetical protein BDQ17DRAFT_1353150 [Cyathus striatus]|nr:hypothetical protein BDQ17DRAFT_1353150 [Cyathus striatus]
MSTPAKSVSPPTSSKPSSSKSLNDYQLGDSLGKGAFGQVYRALNWATGETVAVKEIQLSNIPKSELGEIMHPNIVKYKGFVKTREYLYIILEFCENGSLHNILKRFGKFPETLGLVYLHDQGVIHRDIKGANLLTNKDGTVKLADFGVAAKTGGTADAAVVGSPYWMAPEVIEQSGATTASDVWSVGCVVIELLEGHPPYHTLDPMPALFRIVQDDCPPIPEGASPIVKDFLYHCFQKDANLRISAKKLLRHPWMVSARKHGEQGRERDVKARDGARVEKGNNYNYDEAVLKVQEWNEALKSPSRPSKNPSRTAARPASPTPAQRNAEPAAFPGLGTSAPSRSIPQAPSRVQPGSAPARAPTAAPPRTVPAGGLNLIEKIQIQPLSFALQAPEEQTDNWDDDFEEGISFTKLQALEKTTADEHAPEPEDNDNLQTIRPTRSPDRDIAPIVEDYSDLAAEEDDLEEKVAGFKLKNPPRKGLFHPDDIKTIGLGNQSRSSLSPVPGPSGTPGHSRSGSFASGSFGRAEAKKVRHEFGKYTEDDEEDYEDVFGKPSGTTTEQSMQTLQLNTHEDSDEEDPFAEIDEGFSEEDLEANLQRDKYARLTNSVNQLIDELTPSAPDFQLREACDQLLAILNETPDMQVHLVSSHGMLAILEVLEGRCSREVIMKLLHIINLLVTEDIGFLESFCLIGGIPVMMEFTSKKYPSECRLEASNFIRLLCHTSVLTLQMFISCRGLRVLVDLLDEDYTEQTDLCFELQSPTTKNDFCRMFIREGLLDPLSSALLNVMASRETPSQETKMKIIQILLVFCQVSQSDIHVRNALGTRKVIRRLLRACELLEPECLVQMLKAVKHLSMNAMLLEVLQNANALEILIRILDEQSTSPHSTEVSNHVFQTCYNLCRLNKSRQEEAVQAGIIPCLKRVIETSSPLKQFALPILCDLASAGKSCRKLLWQHDGLTMYILSALEAILSWLMDEPPASKTNCSSLPYGCLLKCFVSCKANSFENLLDPFLKITLLCVFKRIIDRLGHNSRAVVRLNLLRLLKSVCEVHPNRAMLVERYGLLGVVERLSRGGGDGAVLVRELAREIVPVLKPAYGLPGRNECESVGNGHSLGEAHGTPGSRLGMSRTGSSHEQEQPVAGLGTRSSSNPNPGFNSSFSGNESGSRWGG